MSYDLRIVTTLEPTTVVLSDFLSERSGAYSVTGELRAGSGHAFVSKQKRGDFVPIFSVDGPFSIEAEDLDGPLVGLLLAPRWLIEINVPAASSQAEMKLARSLGVKLAKAFQGAVYDPQEDVVVWPRRRPKMYKTPKGVEKIDLVRLRWYLPYSRRVSETARLFVETAERYLYECLPRRFGLFEPFQGKVENGDFSGFCSKWEEAAAAPYGDLLHFSCSAPCYGGSATFSDPRDQMPRNVGTEKMVKLQVDIDGRAMVEPPWRDAAVTFFVRVARVLGSFYAIGYVERGVEAKGRALYFTGSSKVYPLPRHTRWLGVPAIPAWLTWFGPPYAAAVDPACDGLITDVYDEGFLIMRAKQPLGLDSLSGGFPEIPAELRAKLSEQTLSGQLGSIYFGPGVSPNDDRLVDRPADRVLPLE